MHNSAICMKSENLREFRKYSRAICAILQKFHCHITPGLGPSTYMKFYLKDLYSLHNKLDCHIGHTSYSNLDNLTL